MKAIVYLFWAGPGALVDSEPQLWAGSRTPTYVSNMTNMIRFSKSVEVCFIILLHILWLGVVVASRHLWRVPPVMQRPWLHENVRAWCLHTLSVSPFLYALEANLCVVIGSACRCIHRESEECCWFMTVLTSLLTHWVAICSQLSHAYLTFSPSLSLSLYIYTVYIYICILTYVYIYI